MTRRERKYTIDSNLYIRAFRDPAANAALRLFHMAFAPFEYLTAIVAQEMRAGAHAVGVAAALQQHILEPFERRGRILTPSWSAWKLAGEVVARLAADDGLDLARVSKAFANDVLLALTCREHGVVLVTGTPDNFARIRRFASFDFVEPWPSPAR